MINELTESEYKSTMGDKMVDVTETMDSVVDIWPYVHSLTEDKVVLNSVYENEFVEAVYRNEQNTFHHVLLPTDYKNIFIVLIVDVMLKKIKGHFKLDLNEQYGLT